MFKMVKVFDCQEMSDDVRKAFFEAIRENMSPGNDCYVNWSMEEYAYVLNPNDEECAYDSSYMTNYKLVCAWLVENGANVPEVYVEGKPYTEEEDLLISHWW